MNPQVSTSTENYCGRLLGSEQQSSTLRTALALAMRSPSSSERHRLFLSPLFPQEQAGMDGDNEREHTGLLKTEEFMLEMKLNSIEAGEMLMCKKQRTNTVTPGANQTKPESSMGTELAEWIQLHRPSQILPSLSPISDTPCD
ncbi:hypothetical protein MC885_006540, partial [Smutsia gigantea]